MKIADTINNGSALRYEQSSPTNETAIEKCNREFWRISKQEASIESRRGKKSMLHDFKGATWRGPRKGEEKQQVDRSRGGYLRSGKRAEVVISGV